MNVQAQDQALHTTKRTIFLTNLASFLVASSFLAPLVLPYTWGKILKCNTVKPQQSEAKKRKSRNTLKERIRRIARGKRTSIILIPERAPGWTHQVSGVSPWLTYRRSRARFYCPSASWTLCWDAFSQGGWAWTLHPRALFSIPEWTQSIHLARIPCTARVITVTFFQTKLFSLIFLYLSTLFFILFSTQIASCHPIATKKFLLTSLHTRWHEPAVSAIRFLSFSHDPTLSIVIMLFQSRSSNPSTRIPWTHSTFIKLNDVSDYQTQNSELLVITTLDNFLDHFLARYVSNFGLALQCILYHFSFVHFQRTNGKVLKIIDPARCHVFLTIKWRLFRKKIVTIF